MKQRVPPNPSRFAAALRLSMMCVLAAIGADLGLAADAPSETFHAYIDSDVCSRLMLGPVTPARIECSQKMHKQGSDPVVVRLKDNAVFKVNKQKQLKTLVGQLAEITGRVNEKTGKVKLEAAQAVEMSSIPEGAPGREMLDVRNYRARDARVAEQIRHNLAMMPYISEYDFISFTMVGNDVILSGWTVRISNRNVAYNIVKNVEGVGEVTNNIEVLPMGRIDMQIRAGARIRLQRMLPRYFWGGGSDIKIVVKNGDIILLGSVNSQSDADVAEIQCKSVPGSYHVFNMLRVSKG